MNSPNNMIRSIAVLFAASSLLSTGTSNFAQDDVQKNPRPPNRAELKSPLLRGLQQSIENSQVVSEAEADGVLLDQLQEADDLLGQARALNSFGFRSANRQHRIGAAAQSPHLLLITVDRLGAGDLSCYGSKNINTPHIDSIALTGMRFDAFYGSQPSTTGANWSLQTGRSGYDHKRGKENRFTLSPLEPSLGSLMWDSGYLTAFFGYWSNGDRPTHHGYESWSGFTAPASAMNPFPESITVDSTKVRIVGNRDGNQRVSAAAMLSSEFASWIQHHRKTRRQFFVHFDLVAFADLTQDSKKIAASDYQQRIEQLDKTVGAVLETLNNTGVARRTMVIFVAKTGPSWTARQAVTQLNSTAGLRFDESGLTEGNLRVPCLIRWPGKTIPGSESDHPVAIYDILPTMLSVAMSQKRTRLDGQTMQATWAKSANQKKSPRILYFESGHKNPGQAVRKGHWKLVRKSGAKSLQLYDLAQDPSESKNVVEANPKVVAGLIRK